MKKTDNALLTESFLLNALAENNKVIFLEFAKVHERFERVDERFKNIDQRFEKIDERFERVHKRFAKIDTEIARVHREIGNLRDDVMDVLDQSIVPQIEEHRCDISLLKRAVVAA
jgi:archaellum component FlaC